MIITKRLLKELLEYDPDTGDLTWKHRPEKYFPSWQSYRCWNGAWAGKKALNAKDHKGYKTGAVFYKLYPAHRIIWVMIYGRWPEQIDHINGVKSDNRIVNLREVDNLRNHRNMGIQKNNKSGVTGVSWKTKDERWCAAITVRRKTISLGYFMDFDAAVAARKAAEIKYRFHPNHGDRIRNA